MSKGVAWCYRRSLCSAATDAQVEDTASRLVSAHAQLKGLQGSNQELKRRLIYLDGVLKALSTVPSHPGSGSAWFAAGFAMGCFEAAMARRSPSRGAMHGTSGTPNPRSAAALRFNLTLSGPKGVPLMLTAVPTTLARAQPVRGSGELDPACRGQLAATMRVHTRCALIYTSQSADESTMAIVSIDSCLVSIAFPSSVACKIQIRKPQLTNSLQCALRIPTNVSASALSLESPLSLGSEVVQRLGLHWAAPPSAVLGELWPGPLIAGLILVCFFAIGKQPKSHGHACNNGMRNSAEGRKPQEGLVCR